MNETAVENPAVTFSFRKEPAPCPAEKQSGGVLAASLILAKPQNDKAEVFQALPSGESSPAVTIDSESDFVQLASDFPAPVMSFLSGSGMTFVSGVSADTAVSGGFSIIICTLAASAAGAFLFPVEEVDE